MQPVTEMKFSIWIFVSFPSAIRFQIPPNLYTSLLKYLEKVNTNGQS